MNRLTSSQTELTLIISHLAFGLICLAVLLTDFPRGWQFASLVLFYNLMLPMLAYICRRSDWMQIWLLVLPLSFFQVFPDWWLSAYMEVLVFPEDGFLKIGTVSAYMAGLWVIPLFIIVYTGEQVRRHISPRLAHLSAGVIGLIIFATSEATLWQIGSWYATDVKMIGHIAIYVLPAEFILSIAAFSAYRVSLKYNVLSKIALAFCVMLAYSGALNFFYFFIEH